MSSGNTSPRMLLAKHVTELERDLDRIGIALSSQKLRILSSELSTLRGEALGMRIGEYQYRAAQLSFYVNNRGPYGAYNREEHNMAVLGLVGEFFNEVEDQLDNGRWTPTRQLEEELGDFMWYVALLASCHHVDLGKWESFDVKASGKKGTYPATVVPGRASGNNSRVAYMRQLRKVIGGIAEREKKERHGSGKPYTCEEIDTTICTLFSLATDIMHRCRLDPTKVYARNIEKLEKRSGKKTTLEGYHG